MQQVPAICLTVCPDPGECRSSTFLDHSEHHAKTGRHTGVATSQLAGR
jgi:hypothetical protein